MPTPKAFVAELVGTFALVFVGGAAIVQNQELLVVALAHGLILATMASATLHVSGGQINPAVSFALAVIGKQTWVRAGVLAAAQIAGAIGGAFALRWLLGGAGETRGLYTDGGDGVRLVVLEAIGTFMLMFVIMGTAVDRRGVAKSATIAGLGIGLVLAAIILCMEPMTGASLNPARTLGPAIAANFWQMHWVYWVGPIVGATVSAVVYLVAFGEDAPPDTDAAGG